jgi:hypothetical protein
MMDEDREAFEVAAYFASIGAELLDDCLVPFFRSLTRSRVIS